MFDTPTRAPKGLWLLLVALLLLLGLPATGTTWSTQAFAGGDEPTEEEDEAPDEDADEEDVEEIEVVIPWVMDLAAAKKQAAAEGKDLFINFTGSDWCGYCHRLHDEVFSHAEFLDAATKQFVFVYLDFPHGEEAMAKVLDKDLNEKTRDLYGVQGFPTILLTTATGAPYGRTGYEQGGPEAYLQVLADLRTGGEKIKKLIADSKHTDTDALKAAFPVLAEQQLLGYPDYDWTLAAAEKLDPNGELELLPHVQAERERRLMAEEEKGLFALFPKQRDEEPDRLAIADYLLKSKYLAGPQFLNICFGISNWLLGEGADPALAKKLLERAAKDPLASEHPQAKRALEQFMQRAEEALNPPEEPADDDTGEEPDEPEDDGGTEK